jgi:hypothetical protein
VARAESQESSGSAPARLQIGIYIGLDNEPAWLGSLRFVILTSQKVSSTWLVYELEMAR